MNLVLIASILIRLLAMGWAINLWRRLKDWRIGFLTAMLALMALRQILTLQEDETDPATELPGLIVSVMIFIIVVIMERMLVERQSNERKFERLAAEEGEWKERYEAAAKASGQILYDWDIQTNQIVLGGNLQEILGYSREETGKNLSWWSGLVHPDDREAFGKEIERLVATKDSCRLEYRIHKKDGTYILVEDKGCFFPGRDGKRIRMVGFVGDITERKKAEQALQDTEARLRLAVQSSDVGLWDWDLQTKEVYFSPQWKNQLGYQDTEIPNRCEEWESRLHPDDREGALATLHSYLEHPWPNYEIEFRLRHKNGSYRWILTRGELLLDAEGRPIRMLGCHIDITERKDSEEALLHIAKGVSAATGETFFRQLAEHLADALHADYAFVGELMGQTADRIRTTAVFGSGRILDNFEYDLAHTPCANVVGQEICSYPTGVQKEFPEDVLLQQMGIDSYVGTPLFATSGQALGLMVVLFKTALKDSRAAESMLRIFAARAAAELERKRTEEQVLRNLDRIKILQGLNEAITSTLEIRTVFKILLERIDETVPGCALTIRLANRETGALERTACWNLDEKEWQNRPFRTDAKVGRLVIETRTPVSIEDVQKDPRTRDVRFFYKHGFRSYLALPLIAKGDLLGVLSLYTKAPHAFSSDEVEFLASMASLASIAIYNSQLHEQTKKQATELELANRVKDEFLSVMSHELRTPLNVIFGYAGMVEEGIIGQINSAQQKALGKIKNHASDLLSMVGGILQATSLHAEAVKLKTSTVRLFDLLQEVKDSYEITNERRVTLEWDFSSDLPCLYTDGEKLQHILQNLLNNALKFTETGSIMVSVRHDADDRGIVLKVTDTGIGIAPDNLPHVFKMFRQVDSSETRAYGGAGLGLYIVKRFSQLLGGDVTVESELGKGSTFTVTLPITPP